MDMIVPQDLCLVPESTDLWCSYSPVVRLQRRFWEWPGVSRWPFRRGYHQNDGKPWPDGLKLSAYLDAGIDLEYFCPFEDNVSGPHKTTGYSASDK